jgi:hypothetical protein
MSVLSIWEGRWLLLIAVECAQGLKAFFGQKPEQTTAGFFSSLEKLVKVKDVVDGHLDSS